MTLYDELGERFMNNPALEHLHPRLVRHLAQSGIDQALTPPTAEAWRSLLVRLNLSYCQLETLGAFAPAASKKRGEANDIALYLRGETDDAEAQAAFHLPAESHLSSSAVMTIPVRFA
jgi:hypothetical protein